jgi:hypothetical protein
VVFPLDRHRDLHDILNDLLDDLFHWVWLVNVGDMLNWHLDDLDLGNRHVIGCGVGSFDNLVDGVGNRSVHYLLHCVGNLNLNRDRNINGLRNRYVLGDDVLGNLLDGVGNWPVNQSLNWDWNGDGHSDFDWTGNVDNLLDNLFNGVRNLSVGNTFHGVWDWLVNDLFDHDRLNDLLADLLDGHCPHIDDLTS